MDNRSAFLSCAQRALDQGVLHYIRTGSSIQPVHHSIPTLPGLDQPDHLPEWLLTNSPTSTPNLEEPLTAHNFKMTFPRGGKEHAVLETRKKARNNPIATIQTEIISSKDPQIKLEFIPLPSGDINGKKCTHRPPSSYLTPN